MTSAPAISARDVKHQYGERAALRGLTFEIKRGEIFAFLGPNGGGKTTLFRLLSTLIPLRSGEVNVLDFDLRSQVHEIRQRIGVVFQAPSLDKKLTVRENLRHQAALHGLRGPLLAEREREMLQRLGLADRSDDLVEKLSGGMRRRVELAKGMLHRPGLLLLDEPSTGLDPGARSDLWEYLELVRRRDGVTVVLTTHLLEEADKADRIAILSEGSLVALDSPSSLRSSLGGDSITLESPDPEWLAAAIQQQFGCPAQVVGGSVRLQQAAGHAWIARLVESLPGRIDSITVGKPSLEDVFVARTGHRFWDQQEARLE